MTTPLPPSLYEYTLSPPTTDSKENIRLGYRTPRSLLAPPYIYQNPYFVALLDAVDYVFETTVDIPTEVLGDLRKMWVTNPMLENNQIANSELIPFEAWSQPEWEILVKQVNMLGMKLQSASVLTNDNYQSIARWVGQYWFGKGTSAFINFINYCLSSSLAIEQLWTADYITFYPTGDSRIGTPIWEGGTWYPTPNVAITASGGLQSLDVQTLTTFFYEIANYNIVLHDIALTFDIPITTTPTGTNAPVVALGLNMVQAVPISNLYSYGANSPELTITDEVPTAAWTTNPGNIDLTGVYMLAAPTSWIQDTMGRVFPLYDGPQQVPVLETELPTTLCGPVVAGATSVIYGPVMWQAIPTGTYSGGRLPVFSTMPVAKTADLGEAPTNLVGFPTCLLVNPTGFAEFVLGSGLYSPYWTGSPVL
jgi:hypothetical protein